MESGFNTVKDYLEVIIWLAGSGALVYAASTYRLNKNQFSFAVMTSCIDRFQKVMAQLKSTDEDLRSEALQRYVDLCNEELFYFKNNYLPEEVVNEWIEGMIFYLPHFDESGNNLNHDPIADEIVEKDLLKDYPRIRKALSVREPYPLNTEDSSTPSVWF